MLLSRFDNFLGELVNERPATVNSLAPLGLDKIDPFNRNYCACPLIDVVMKSTEGVQDQLQRQHW